MKKEQVDRAWLLGTFKGSKCNSCYCDTPTKDISEMVKSFCNTYPLSERKQNMNFCEPSFGTGEILKQLKVYFGNNSTIYGYELNKDNYYKTLKNLGYENHSEFYFSGGGYRLYNYNFLSYDGERRFDGIFMVPPFGNKAFIDHVVHAIDLLDENGVLVAIIPAVVFDGISSKPFRFRNYLSSFNYTVIPMGSAVCNYPVETVLLTLRNESKIYQLDELMPMYEHPIGLMI